MVDFNRAYLRRKRRKILDRYRLCLQAIMEAAIASARDYLDRRENEEIERERRNKT